MAERLPGRATPEGTRRGAESFEAGSRTLGRTELTVSPVGFGCYRVRVDAPLHRRALADALRAGCNLVDTSTNYGDGRSEQLVGLVLANLVQQGELRREHVVVVSKVGYVQGRNQERMIARGRPYPEVVEYAPDCWHCIHPQFVRDQLEESLDRLGLAELDVLLLHNPEYFLSDAAHRGVDPQEARAAFDDRIRRAFVALEELVAAGKIGSYGVSSNGFVDASDEPGHTSLRRMIEIAREVAGDAHHFAVAQLPMNLFELGAMLERREGTHPLDIAARNDIGVLVNRPLNAFVEREGRPRLVRLADVQAGEGDGFAQARKELAAVRKLEAAWATGLGRRLATEDGGDDAADLFRWGQELGNNLDAITDLDHWQHIRHETIGPHLGKTSAALLSALPPDAREIFARWWADYGTAMHAAFVAIEAGLRSRRHDTARAVTEALDPLLPEPWRSLPLSRKAVLALLSAPVSSVLVGMRQPGYVHDILALREHPVRLLSAATGPVAFDRLADALQRVAL